MPSPEDQMLVALKTQKNDEMIQLVKENPHLVNMVVPNDQYSSSMMYMLLKANRPSELIQFFVTHKDFNFQFINLDVGKQNYTNIEELVHYGRRDVLAAIIDKPEILMTQNKLTYARARLILEVEETKLAEKQRKMPNSKTIEKDIARINEIRKMIPMIREATIRHAIATDDPSLLDQLEAAGDDLRDDLNNGMAPYQSLANSNTKLYEWFPNYFSRHPVNREVVKNIHAFFENKNKKIEEITNAHHERLAAIHNDATERREARMDEVNNILKNK